jgi:hypothetical protein
MKSIMLIKKEIISRWLTNDAEVKLMQSNRKRKPGEILKAEIDYN